MLRVTTVLGGDCYRLSGFQVTNLKTKFVLGFSQYDRLKAIFTFPNNFPYFKPYFVDHQYRLQGLRYFKLKDGCVIV